MNQELKKYIIAQLSNLSSEELLEVAQECNEILGVVSVKDCIEILCDNRRTIYDRLKKNKIKYLEISNIKFPCINFK